MVVNFQILSLLELELARIALLKKYNLGKFDTSVMSYSPIKE